MRAVWEVVAGTRHAQQLAEALVAEAVARTLQRVCAAHPLDYDTLVAAHQPAVVQACTAAFRVPDAFAQCEGTTRKGKRCTRRAVVGGVCEKHVGAWRAQAEAQRRREVYEADSRPAAAAGAPHAGRARVAMSALSPGGLRALL